LVTPGEKLAFLDTEAVFIQSGSLQIVFGLYVNWYGALADGKW
jgi:hypothetical protein